METILRFRYNIMNITSIGSFAHIKGGINHGCKDVYFVRALGTNTDMLKDIADMDETLSLLAVNGKGFYKRVSELPKLVSTDDAVYYSNCYDEWVKNGRKEISIKTLACKNADFRKMLSQACLCVGNLYADDGHKISESMLKNFIVKVLFWYDSLFNIPDFVWAERLNSKIVVCNVSKKQEYLFWYAVTMTGQDVMLLQPKADIQIEKKLDELSLCFPLGDFAELQIPQYVRPAMNRKEKPAANIAAATNIVMATESENNKIDMAQKVKAVVPGYERKSRSERSYEELAQLSSSVVLISIHGSSGEIIGTGSGIMIGKEGYILTNNHVASGGRFYSVQIEEDDKTYATDEVIKYNPVLDLAIIRIERKLEPLPIYNGPQKLVRGQKVVAIGSPLGLFNSVSDGIISGFRTIDAVDMIQFTAPISHGSSGGAVLNMYGEVIGISTAGIDSGQNINLAVGYECINMFIKGFT